MFPNLDYIFVDYLLFFADMCGDDEGQASWAAICKIRCLINFGYIKENIAESTYRMH